MSKIGRNSPCPCGSGEKYKRCCEAKEAAMRAAVLPAGRFRYEPGSYGGPGRGYMPSILGYKETGPDSWTEHLCLARLDAAFDDPDEATSQALEDLSAAQEAKEEGGSAADFALFLRHAGYKSVSDFRIVNEDG